MRVRCQGSPPPPHRTSSQPHHHTLPTTSSPMTTITASYLLRVERAVPAREALHDDAGVLVHEYRRVMRLRESGWVGLSRGVCMRVLQHTWPAQMGLEPRSSPGGAGAAATGRGWPCPQNSQDCAAHGSRCSKAVGAMQLGRPPCCPTALVEGSAGALAACRPPVCSACGCSWAPAHPRSPPLTAAARCKTRHSNHGEVAGRLHSDACTAAAASCRHRPWSAVLQTPTREALTMPVFANHACWSASSCSRRLLPTSPTLSPDGDHGQAVERVQRLRVQ